MSRQAAYYDRDAGIMFLTVVPRDKRRRGGRYVVFQRPRLGIDRLRSPGGRRGLRCRVLGPAEIFPPDPLKALPHPTSTRWARRRWPIRSRWERVNGSFGSSVVGSVG